MNFITEGQVRYLHYLSLVAPEATQWAYLRTRPEGRVPRTHDGWWSSALTGTQASELIEEIKIESEKIHKLNAIQEAERI